MLSPDSTEQAKLLHQVTSHHPPTLKMGHRHASTPTCLPHPMPLLHPLYEHQRDSLARWIVLAPSPPLFWSRHVVRCTMLWSCLLQVMELLAASRRMANLNWQGRHPFYPKASLSCAMLFNYKSLTALGYQDIMLHLCSVRANRIGLSRPSAPPASSTAKQPCPMLCAGLGRFAQPNLCTIN